MSTDLATRTEPAATSSPKASVPAAVVSPLPQRSVAPIEFTPAQLEIIRANGGHALEADELEAFMYQVRRTGLSPLARQIYAVKRYSAKEKREVMTIQTGIDGYRLIADRTSRYSPSERPPVLDYDGDGQLHAATVFVKKLTDDGTWHEVPGTALFREFAQKDRDGNLTSFWRDMPVNQLSKCAEAQALRRAFPNDLSGIWTTETAPREDFDVEVSATPPRRAIAPPQSKSAAPAPKPVERALAENEKRFVVVPDKTTRKETKAKKEFWELKAKSGESFTAWRKDHETAFQTAMDRGWQVEVIEKQNGQYWNVEKVTMIEPAPAAATSGPAQPEPVPPVDVLDGVSDEARRAFELEPE